MRVLVVTHAYPRWDGDVAGAFIERLCLDLRGRGHALEVIAPSDQGTGGRDERHGLPIERVRYGSPEQEMLAYRGTMTDAARSLTGVRSFARLVSAFRNAIVDRAGRGPVDLVHAHWWLPGGIGAWRAATSIDLPYLVTLHGTDVALLRRSAIARAVARRVLRNAARVTAVSAFLADEAARACAIEKAAILVQPMPISPDRLDRPDRRRAEHSGGELRLLTVGRLTRQKRVELLLLAIRRLIEANVPVRGTIVGDGPERAALEALAGRLDLEAGVRFTGAVPPETVGEYLDESDVFVFPAEHEGLGLAAAEALMHGVPVVACTDGGGAREVVMGGGRVVPPDPAALAEAIRSLAYDPDARRQATAAGQTWRRRLAPDAVADAFEHAYERALTGRS